MPRPTGMSRYASTYRSTSYRSRYADTRSNRRKKNTSKPTLKKKTTTKKPAVSYKTTRKTPVVNKSSKNASIAKASQAEELKQIRNQKKTEIKRKTSSNKTTATKISKNASVSKKSQVEELNQIQNQKKTTIYGSKKINQSVINKSTSKTPVKSNLSNQKTDIGAIAKENNNSVLFNGNSSSGKNGNKVVIVENVMELNPDIGINKIKKWNQLENIDLSKKNQDNSYEIPTPFIDRSYLSVDLKEEIVDSLQKQREEIIFNPSHLFKKKDSDEESRSNISKILDNLDVPKTEQVIKKETAFETFKYIMQDISLQNKEQTGNDKKDVIETENVEVNELKWKHPEHRTSLENKLADISNQGMKQKIIINTPTLQDESKITNNDLNFQTLEESAKIELLQATKEEYQLLLEKQENGTYAKEYLENTDENGMSRMYDRDVWEEYIQDINGDYMMEARYNIEGIVELGQMGFEFDLEGLNVRDMSMEEYVNTMGPIWELSYNHRTDADFYENLKKSISVVGASYAGMGLIAGGAGSAAGVAKLSAVTDTTLDSADVAVSAVSGDKAGTIVSAVSLALPEVLEGIAKNGRGLLRNSDKLLDDDVMQISTKNGLEEIDEGISLIESGGSSVDLAKASQGNEVYTGVDDWEPVQLKKGEIYYRGEPNGTDFFTVKESIESVDTSKRKLFEGLQVREDPIHGYRSEMQGYILNADIDAAQALCLNNSQFGVGGLEQKYISNAKELIDNGTLVPVDKILLK